MAELTDLLTLTGWPPGMRVIARRERPHPGAQLTAWTQLLAFTGHAARRWEPKRLRHRVFTIPATLARTGRRVRLHLKGDAAYAHLVLTGWTALAVLAPH